MQIHKLIGTSAAAVCAIAFSAVAAVAQNWGITIQDLGAGTALNEVNGAAGGTATLHAIVYNYTGTDVSDDGTSTGTPAPPTKLDFAGFGWTHLPGQDDLESRFAGMPFGTVQVDGSLDGLTVGDSGYVVLGTFDLAGLGPGVYEEDFSVAAFATDFTSPVPFDTLTGTLRLNVSPAVVPESSTLMLIAVTGISCCWVISRRALPPRSKQER